MITMWIIFGSITGGLLVALFVGIGTSTDWLVDTSAVILFIVGAFGWGIYGVEGVTHYEWVENPELFCAKGKNRVFFEWGKHSWNSKSIKAYKAVTDSTKYRIRRGMNMYNKETELSIEANGEIIVGND